MEWSADFSYGYFGRLLDAAARSFEIRPLRDAELTLGERPERTVLLRHDIDVDLMAAVRMAEIEAQRGIRSTYMVMTGSPLYDPSSASSRELVRAISAMGHEIALHFDFPDPAIRAQPPSLDACDALIDRAARELEGIAASEVRSVSFHRPLPTFLRGPLRVAHRINAYAAPLMTWYLSDSAGRWREGEPLPMLVRPKRALLQLLIHPIWWGDHHLPAPSRLQDFYERATATMTRDDAARFGAALAAHILVERSGGNA